MATFAEALKDRRGFPDTQEVDLGNGVKMTLGELRGFQEATGQDVAKQLEADRTKLAGEQAAVAQAQAEVVQLWTKLQEAAKAAPAARQPDASSDWTKDPFFAPIAEHLDKNIMSKLTQQAEQIQQFQKALGLGVKYVTDAFSEMRYQSLPEDFRKETPYDAAVRVANEKKFLDSGGIPDVRKVYEDWRAPREREAERTKMREEIRNEERLNLQKSGLARPGGVSVGAAPDHDPNAPKTMKDSFDRLKQDPEFLQQLYGLTGQVQ